MSLFGSHHCCGRRFLTIIVGWRFISISLCTSVSDPSLFSPENDDTSILAKTDPSAMDPVGGVEEFSSGLFSDPSSVATADLDSSIFQPDSNLANLDDDSSWLLTADSDVASQEEVSSCIGDNDFSTMQLFGKKKKTRREDKHPMCLQQDPASSPSLSFPDLLNIHIEQPSMEPSKPMVGAGALPEDSNNPCPPLKRVHVCCAGPVEPEYPWTGLLKQVQNCQSCMFVISSSKLLMLQTRSISTTLLSSRKKRRKRNSVWLK